MADKKIIAVIGATGAQGGGLVRAIMNDPSSGFTARAITRDVNTDKARGLAALGAGYAVAQVGTAALGALAEKPELFGRVLVMVGLAEGIAIYGLIVSILILNRLG